ncbi:glycerate kinase [Neolewinella aurantiaca]|uniref:Glycerate kinase n=1 Tax=Neolewinella aurantiaca TaxID=2602767 RepID=A0A5C7FUN1_9BACT|nr:glycerate kinase [Neolewinella aurantiaca]TXF90297.1 glycerate kinase [Neolewinella aurantiaca]
MNVLIAPDKFKGSLSANSVCEAIATGIRRKYPAAKVAYHPLADGGDGTLDILEDHLNLMPVTVAARDPLGRPLRGRYLLGFDFAFIEVATASGLVLLTPEERNPLHTSTFGTGMMLADALNRGVRTIYLLLGGSATHDLGTGIATALGFRFLAEDGSEVPPNGAGLERIHRIVPPKAKPWEKTEIVLLCDVTNPLIGPRGSAHVYAAQKGADAAMIDRLENGGQILGRQFDEFAAADVSTTAGGGAAGGIAAGLCALLGATLRSGFQTISELTGLEAAIGRADHVITGEGRLDEQSLEGKVVGGVIGSCVRQGKPYSVVVGSNILSSGFDWPGEMAGVLEVMSLAGSTEQAMEEAAGFLVQLGEKVKL